MSETLTKCEADVRDDFERRWAVASPYGSVERAREYGNRPVPCDCGEPDCCGWRMDCDPAVLHERLMQSFAAAAYEAGREMGRRRERAVLEAILGPGRGIP